MGFFRFPPLSSGSLLALASLIMASVFFLSLSSSLGCAAGPDSGTEFLETAPPIAASSYKQPALLTIFYNASTSGELHPCPT